MSPLFTLSALMALPTPQGTSTALDGEHLVPEVVHFERQVSAMGTRLSLVLEAPSRGQALTASEAALAAVEGVEARLSSWRPESELSLLGRSPVGQHFEASPELFADLTRAFAWRAVIAAAFDPAIAPLIEAWDLRGEGRRPSPAELEVARASSGPQAFQLTAGGRVLRLREGAGLDAGAFGKGAGLDAALAALREAGIQRARLDFGGQVAVLAAEDPYTLAIADPDQRGRGLLALELRAGSVATSGNSERHVVVDGQRLGHLLDPRSGAPALDFGSVTVRCADAFDADCLATALFVLGPEAALELAARLPAVEAVVLTRQDGRLRARASAGLRGQLHTLDPELRIEWIPISPGRTPSHPSQP